MTKQYLYFDREKYKTFVQILASFKKSILNQIRLRYAKNEKTTCEIPVDDTAVYAYVVQMNILKKSLQYIFVLSLNIVIPYSSIDTSCTNRSFENLKFNKGVFIWLGWVQILNFLINSNVITFTRNILLRNIHLFLKIARSFFGL